MMLKKFTIGGYGEIIIPLSRRVIRPVEFIDSTEYTSGAVYLLLGEEVGENTFTVYLEGEGVEIDIPEIQYVGRDGDSCLFADKECKYVKDLRIRIEKCRPYGRRYE